MSKCEVQVDETASHTAIVNQFFDQAAKFSRSGVFQLKKAQNALGMDHEEKTVNMSGWLDFCNTHQVRRRFTISEVDLRNQFDMCRNGQSTSSDSLNKDQFQQCLIMLGSIVGLRASNSKQKSISSQQVSHGSAFDSLIGVVVQLKNEFDRPIDPWPPLLTQIPKLKTLFQKVAKNSKDPIGSLGKSGSLVSSREFVAFYEQNQINQKFSADVPNAKLFQIFKKSQITDNNEKSQCDIQEFSFAIMLLAIELGVLKASTLEFYADSDQGVHSMFDHCDPETGAILKDFVLALLDAPLKSDDLESAIRTNAAKKQRMRNVSLLKN
jgi:hypothetical protein